MEIIKTMKATKTTHRGLARGRRLITLLALISLAAAYYYGFFAKGNESFHTIQAGFPGKSLEKTNNSKWLFNVIDNETGAGEGLVVVQESQGWGGPLRTATWIGQDKEIRRVVVVSHKETPSFFQHLVGNGFFEQFSGKYVNEAFEPKEDVDAVSGATISSVAFTKAVRKGAHKVANEQYGYQIEEPPIEWNIGKDEIVLGLLYTVVLICLVKKFLKARMFVLGFSVLFLGIRMNRPISLSNLTSILLGYLPSAHEQLFWWLLVAGVLGLTMLMGKNFYCYWMCPFGGIQELVTKIGGVRFRLDRRVTGILKNMVYIMLWLALMITFLTSNPGLGMFEPFATLFSLKGTGIQWYMVSVAMIGSFFIPRFWCRFFCPVGLCLNQVGKVKTGFRKGYEFIVTKGE